MTFLRRRRRTLIVAFLALCRIELPQAHHLAHDLGVEAVAFGFGIDFADVAAQRGLFFFKPLDAFDDGLQLILGEIRLGHGEHLGVEKWNERKRAANLTSRQGQRNAPHS